MDKQKVLAKVEKLMALANAKGATPNEAETALRQAAILKRQFDLSEAEISAHVAQQKRCKLSTKRRRSKLFVEGWLLAVRSLVRDFAGRPDESTQAAIKAYLELHHPELKLLEPAAPTKPLAYDQASLHAGWEHGKNTRLHRGVSRRVQGALEQGGSR